MSGRFPLIRWTTSSERAPPECCEKREEKTLGAVSSHVPAPNRDARTKGTHTGTARADEMRVLDGVALVVAHRLDELSEPDRHIDRLRRVLLRSNRLDRKTRICRGKSELFSKLSLLQSLGRAPPRRQ